MFETLWNSSKSTNAGGTPQWRSSALIGVALVLLPSCLALEIPTHHPVRGSCRPKPVEMSPPPPLAKKVPYYHEYHGVKYLDEYNWLRDDLRNNSEVLAYLKQENEYAGEILKPLEPLTDKIYQEIIKRVSEDDATYPITKGDYEYYSKTTNETQYHILCRKRKDRSTGKVGDEEVMLDLNKFTEKQLTLGKHKVSPDHKALAYPLDTTGSETYDIFIKNLSTGKTDKEVKGTGESVIWSTDSKYIFYTTSDETHRSYRVYRHKVGDKSDSDVLLYEEKDTGFIVVIRSSISEKYMSAISAKHTETELRYLDLSRPLSELTLFSSRKQGRIYTLEHQDDQFLIKTNWYLGKKYINNYILQVPINEKLSHQDEKAWKEVIPYDDKHYITECYGLKNHIVLGERFEEYSQIRIIETSTGSKASEGQLIKFPESIFVSKIFDLHLDYNQAKVVYSYSSLLTPTTIYRYDITSKSSKVMKKSSVLGYTNPQLYHSERLVAENDVPISVVYRKDKLKRDGSNPLHLTGYGSYGLPSDPNFQTTIFSLLDRGFVYAIAHVRGGTEMGRQWYETEGKFLNKKNTFRDFASVARHLIKLKYTSPEVLSIEGGSAGGLLMGAVINANPGLYNAAIASVPFVDVINTMMDPTIPLTVFEYEEWGNPNNKTFFDYMLSYSPYNNLPAEPAKFPHMLVRSGYNDPRVSYWEPAKYVAKLREHLSKPNASKRTKVLQIIEMNSGHFGASGIKSKYMEVAQNYAFLISTAKHTSPFF